MGSRAEQLGLASLAKPLPNEESVFSLAPAEGSTLHLDQLSHNVSENNLNSPLEFRLPVFFGVNIRSIPL